MSSASSARLIASERLDGELVVPKRSAEKVRHMRALTLHPTVIAILMSVLLQTQGDVFARSKGVEAYLRGDYSSALRELTTDARAGEASAQFWLGRMYETGRGVRKNEQEAITWYRKSARQDFLEAQFRLGEIFEGGVGVDKNEEIAVAWYQLAADRKNGHDDAQFRLGLMYQEGRGVPKDDQLAVSWYLKAAEQGHRLAQVFLGDRYEDGRGVSKNDEVAAGWYQKAADQGDEYAQFRLGVMYYTGRGVSKDGRTAFGWYLKAAEQGYLGAQVNVGIMLSEGEGTIRDDLQAAGWFRKAAKQGDAGAAFNLGLMYAKGQGVPRDDQQALTWYRQSANQGFASAQLNLGTMYAQGVGLPKDDAEAYFWYLLASAQGDEKALRARDSLERRLTGEQRAAAQARARVWSSGGTGESARGKSGADASQQDSKKPARTGSGFRTTGGTVITNYHVVKDCGRIAVNGDRSATITGADERNDLALIGTASKTGAVAKLRESRLRIGERVSVAGFPLHGLLPGLNVTGGNLSALQGIKGDSRYFQLTAPVQPGNSGGPVVDSSGNVIGVVVGKLDALKVAEKTGDIPQNVNFAITLNALKAFLEANGSVYKLAPGEAAIAESLVADRAKAFTVLIECWN